MLTMIEAGVGTRSIYSPGSSGVEPLVPSPPMFVAGWGGDAHPPVESFGMQISRPDPARTPVSDNVSLEKPMSVSVDEWSDTSPDTRAVPCAISADKKAMTGNERRAATCAER